MNFAVVILAGGEGTRIGGSKPTRMLGGRTLIDRALERARSWSREVALAARSVEQVGEPGVPVMIDPPGLKGPLGGLASALGVQRPQVLSIPCDMPFLPDDLPDRLAAALGHHDVALAASGGHVHPVCGLWRTGMLAEIETYAATGRRSLIGFAEWVGYVSVEWPGDPFFNINSAEDLAEAEVRLG